MKSAVFTVCILLCCNSVFAQPRATQSPAVQSSAIQNPNSQTPAQQNPSAPNPTSQPAGAPNATSQSAGTQNANGQYPSGENPTAPQGPVALRDEPHHRMVLQNDFARVYSVSVPPQDATLLHRHDLPYIGVTLGPADLVNVVVGKPEARLTLQDGETRYFGTPYSHLVRTDSGLPFWNITVEFLHPQADARNICRQVMDGPLGACPQQTAAAKKVAAESGDDDVPYFETSEVRIDQIKVSQGRDYVDAAPKWNALLIALTGANLDADLGGAHLMFLHAGDVLWLPAGVHRKVVDFLGTKSSFILVSFKDSAAATRP